VLLKVQNLAGVCFQSPELADSDDWLDTIDLPATPLFGTDGIPWTSGELLTAPLASQVGFWAGLILQAQSSTEGPVIVGQDSRNSSDMLAMAMCAGLAASGLKVWHLGLCPTLVSLI
jgi:phosphoglucosamine mutase